MKKIIKNPLFVKILTGTHAFRKASIDFELFTPKNHETLAKKTIWKDSWTNATADEVFNTMQKYEGALPQVVAHTEFKPYRANGQYAFVKGVVFDADDDKVVERFENLGDNKIAKLEKIVENMKIVELKNKIEN